jgi:hypothetical protein
MLEKNSISQIAVKRHRFTWRRIMWVVIAGMILIVAADLALRFGAGLGNPVLYQADAACGYLPKANQNIRRFGSVNFINAFSQRAADLPAIKQTGHYRALFIGDSVTYGTSYVDQSEIVTSLLARSLPQTLHRPVDVMNASAGGWAVGNELGYLKSRGTFGADVVIFVLNTGDLRQPFNHAPHFSTASGYPAKRPFCAISELWVRYLWPRLLRRARPHDAGSTAAPYEPTTDVDVVLGQLDEAKTICDQQHVRMAIVYSPCDGERWRESPYPESLDQLRGWTTKRNIILVDLESAYAQASPKEIYWDGTHLRPKGDALAAAAIKEAWAKITGTSP